ncbi:M14 family zinc carboxypeptidase [Marinigracilibium pacificum]|uniref:M14 family metallopeptidase n=1 Tax=Marinigracilibium pacificum TaxID=2729599 RepID=A0A848IUF8_9BACT|nr:M14 family zinc carboxypeptidase [Marinigracilibium pacificum]NMM46828.1 M14 family metallopeptidase [Marinigracilibium pacificum]
MSFLRKSNDLLSVLIIFLLNIPFVSNAQFSTIFEQSKGKNTATYEEGIAFYRSLAAKYNTINIDSVGLTDSGKPLHLVTFSSNEVFDYEKLHQSGKKILMINNAIHPGEPDGVEASMMLLRDIATGKVKVDKNMVLAIIPFYNIAGVLNRNSFTRANQNGPEEYGFRGNARNFDLNRDFIKSDTRNAFAFHNAFLKVKPHLFVDTHVSNGADYQYVITMVYPQKDKLGGATAKVQEEILMPFLFGEMEKSKYPAVPYVNVFGRTPDSGWQQFLEGPRYSSGYAALFQTIAFQSETHMLKPFSDRVNATYLWLNKCIKALETHGDAIAKAQAEDRKNLMDQTRFSLSWEVDTSRFQTLKFKGYEGETIESKVSGGDRLYYNHNKPFVKDVKFYDSYKPVNVINAPRYYIVQQQWHEVTSRLKNNHVKLQKVKSDTTLLVSYYVINSFETVNRPYEGHYLHYNIKTSKLTKEVNLRKGDYLIDVNQPSKRYIIETLEPEGPDSFFAWNFFDTRLQRKEHFSPYVFEDVAADLIKKDSALKNKLDHAIKENSELEGNAYGQLMFIYENSDYSEEAFMEYPIYRLD